MPDIRLPDGAIKHFDAPVTVADVAASIGPGLAKAALAGRVDGKLVDTSYAHRPRRIARDRHRQGSGRHRGPAPFDRAPARLRGQGTVPRGAGDDRPGDRGRFLLRLLVQASVHARRPGRHRAEDGRASEKGRAGRAQADAARRRGAVLRIARRALQGGDHRLDSGQRIDLALQRRPVYRPVPRTARSFDRQAQGVQADQARRSILARRFQERDAAADLRHRMGEKGGPRRLSAPHRGGGKARSPQARPPARPVPFAGRGAGDGFLASEGLDYLAAGRAVHAPRLPGRTATRRSSAR